MKNDKPEHPERALELLEKLTTVLDETELDGLMDRLAEVDRPFVLSFVNAHGVNMACRDKAFFDALMEADLLLRDGSGMRIMCEVLGKAPGLNLNGTDLIPKILERRTGAPLALCGTTEPYLSEAAAKLSAVSLKLDGFHPVDQYAEPIRQSGAKVVVLAMGMPKQELVAQQLVRQLDGDVLIINGGAILDFIAGRFVRAPSWVRGMGMEWGYRLVREPMRLSERYLVGNTAFLARLAKLKAGSKGESLPTNPTTTSGGSAR